MGRYGPTSADDWRLLGRTVHEVLSRPLYAAVAVVAAVVTLTVFVVSQNQRVILDIVVFGSGIPLAERVRFLSDLYPFLGPAYGRIHGGLLILVAVLLGVNVTLVGYHIAELGIIARDGVVGGMAFVLGTVGAGCAACGSAVLVGVLSLFGVTGALTVLPFEGLEFLGLALVAIGLSIFQLAEGIASDDACPVDIGG
jgi:hypothetical protein